MKASKSGAERICSYSHLSRKEEKIVVIHVGLVKCHSSVGCVAEELSSILVLMLHTSFERKHRTSFLTRNPSSWLFSRTTSVSHSSGWMNTNSWSTLSIPTSNVFREEMFPIAWNFDSDLIVLRFDPICSDFNWRTSPWILVSLDRYVDHVLWSLTLLCHSSIRFRRLIVCVWILWWVPTYPKAWTRPCPHKRVTQMEEIKWLIDAVHIGWTWIFFVCSDLSLHSDEQDSLRWIMSGTNRGHESKHGQKHPVHSLWRIKTRTELDLWSTSWANVACSSLVVRLLFFRVNNWRVNSIRVNVSLSRVNRTSFSVIHLLSEDSV